MNRNRQHRPPPTLAADSLAFALVHAARHVAGVIAGRSLNDVLTAGVRELAGAPPSARAAIQDLTYSTLRDYGRGDFLLARLLHKPLADATVRALLLIALHRLETRGEAAHTTVNQAVAAAASFSGGASRALVNAVLRGFLRQREALLQAAQADDAAHWRHPRWWIDLLRKTYPEEWRTIAEAGNAHPPMALRVNRRRMSPADYIERLREAGIAAHSDECGALLLERPVGIDRLPGFNDGWASVQDPGAQLAAPLLDVAAGQRVLDACAAPGGKTAHILETAAVDLLALDADVARTARIADNLSRLGLSARVASADCRALDRWWDGRPFDRVLADVPCSASGVVRRHPDIKWLRREADIAGFARQQREILDALWRVLAPGGKLLYATCSLFPEENGLNIAAFAARHQDCVRLPLKGRPELQLLPTHTHDGFFYALLQKRCHGG